MRYHEAVLVIFGSTVMQSEWVAFTGGEHLPSCFTELQKLGFGVSASGAIPESFL